MAAACETPNTAYVALHAWTNDSDGSSDSERNSHSNSNEGDSRPWEQRFGDSDCKGDNWDKDGDTECDGEGTAIVVMEGSGGCWQHLLKCLELYHVY